MERRITLRGVVEGVGMRPALYRLARKHHLGGSVVNRAREVELRLRGDRKSIERCWRELPAALPPGARLEAPPEFHDEAYEGEPGEFRILAGEGEATPVNLLTPPDLAMCPRCRAEVFTPGNRRYRYPFNSCGDCGPRASVVETLPYERERTAWRDFPLCPECRREYENPDDRRFHIEGISCPVCGPRLEGLSLEEAGALLQRGEILALKGVGGYQLLADPFQPEAVTALRSLKNRPDKPLALMTRSLETLKQYGTLSPLEEEMLASPGAPIVIVHWRQEPPEGIAPDHPREIGIMLPSSPLHELLLDAFGGDFLIATSGNRRSEPPALDNAAGANLGAAGVIAHNRLILHRFDDAVAMMNADRPQLLRRGRGTLPLTFTEPPRFQRGVAALGAALKNTFVLAGPDSFFLSPHYGELEEAAAALLWERELERALKRSPEPVEAVAVDLHPDYYSTRFGEALAERLGVPLIRVPHHYAHALAGLLESGFERAHALVFDGNGFGPDGLLWGAELLTVGLNGEHRRRATWEPVPLPGGELAIREPHRQLAGRRFAAGLPVDDLTRFQCEKGVNAPRSHAAGRLFDAFAALIGVAPERISYEGQAAIRLEAAARGETWNGRILPFATREGGGVLRIDWSPLFRDPLPESPALSFHHTVAAAALAMAEFAGERLPVILTGGVFQNRLLTELVAAGLSRQGFTPWVPSQLPPNDAGIAAGQAVWAGLNFSL